MIIFNLHHKPDSSSKTILIKSHTASSCKDWPPLKRLSPGLSILIFWLGRVYIPGNPKLGTLQNWNVSVNFHTWAAASTCTELIFPISAEDLTLTFWTQKFTICLKIFKIVAGGMYLNVFPRTATISQIKDDTKWPVFFVHLSDIENSPLFVILI